jgi:electron transfer flavoprotein beta subunit
MRIAVCIKQVPAVADLRMDEKRWTLAREGVPSRVNPHDLQALEMALLLRDLTGGEVVSLTMGPPESEEALREALAMGADKGILLSDSALAGADTLATSTALAQAIRKLASPPELILCGTRTTDSDTGQVGPQVAEDLGIPHVAYVVQVQTEGDALVVQRIVDRRRETLRVRVPILLTVLRASSRPRDIPFLSVEEAFSEKEIEKWGIEALGLKADEVGFAGSATRVRKIREPQETRRMHLVQGKPHEAVKVIVQALMERHILEQGET